MNSSNQTVKNPKLYCIRFKGKDFGCSPDKCTAVKLQKFGILKFISKISGNLKNAIFLNPFSKTEINIDDKEIIKRFGLIVIDCSWKKIINFKDFHFKNERRLPRLMACNPINYGKWEKLSSAEALAAALYLTDFKEDSNLLLSKFSWGKQFIKLNKLK